MTVVSLGMPMNPLLSLPDDDAVLDDEDFDEDAELDEDEDDEDEEDDEEEETWQVLAPSSRLDFIG